MPEETATAANMAVYAAALLVPYYLLLGCVRWFVTLFRAEEGRMGVTVTFIAILELLREGLIEIVQSEPYAPIHVRAGTPRPPDQIDGMDDQGLHGPQGTES